MISVKNLKKYLIPSALLILVLVFFANFIAIRSIGNKIEHFFNQEFKTPMTSIKVRCAESIPQGNLIFINYNKQFRDCKIYNTGFAKVDSDGYNYKSYYIIPKLTITYKLLKSQYHLTFKKFGKYSRGNFIDNYQLTFENPIEFDVKHSKNRITNVSMQNGGDVLLMHDTGIKIADIQDYSSTLKFTDSESELGLDLKINLQFNILHSFLKLMQQHDLKVTENSDANISMDFDVETKFERFSKEEQRELRERNPEKYASEKNFFKNLIYNINLIKISHPKYNFESYGVVKKTTKPGMPGINLHLKINDLPTFANYIQKSMKNTIYNAGQIDVYNELRPDIGVDAFVKTFRDLEILRGDDLNIHLKSDAIGTFSISGVNFFTFQRKFMTNLFKLRAEEFGKQKGRENNDTNTDSNNDESN